VESRAVRVQEVALQKRGEFERLEAEAGPPCTECRFHKRRYEFIDGKTLAVSYCSAPPAQQFKFDPVRRKVGVATTVLAERARGQNGLCGLEGAMFRPRPTVLGMAVSHFVGLIVAIVLYAPPVLLIGFLMLFALLRGLGFDVVYVGG
jgi:hypothetical protein